MFTDKDGLLLRMKIQLFSFKFCFVCGTQCIGSNQITSALNHIISSECFNNKSNILDFEILQQDEEEKEHLSTKQETKKGRSSEAKDDRILLSKDTKEPESGDKTEEKDKIDEDFDEKSKYPDDEFCFNKEETPRLESEETFEKFKYRCEECNATFRADVKLKMHKQFTHRECFTCDLCDSPYEDIAQLMTHMKSSHSDTKKCFVCNKNVKNLWTHLRVHIGRRSYPCPQSNCHQRFVHPESVKKHEKIHQGVTHDCHICHASLAKESNLRYHLEVVHQQEETFRCGYCQAWFKTHQLLVQHLKTQHDVGTQNKVPCEYCGVRFTSKGLKEHIRLKHNEENAPNQTEKSVTPFQHKSVKCDKCGAAFNSQQMEEITTHAEGCKQLHSSEGSNQVFECRYKPCRAKFKDFSHLLHHELFLHTFPPVDISCCACAETFGIDWHAFGNHLARRHWKEKPSINCVVCGETVDPEMVKLHYKQHWGSSWQRCERCCLSFLDARSCRLHCNSHEAGVIKPPRKPTTKTKVQLNLSSPPGQQFCCLLCGFITRSSWNKLVQHFSIHDQLSQLVCQEEICSTEFTSLEELHRHFYTQHKQCFECETCSLVLRSKTFYEVHKATHLSWKDQQCNFCPKSFRTKVQLEIHEARHTGQGRFQCDQCGKRFPQKGELKNHKEQHGENKAYTCHQCGKSFARDSYLRIHMKIHGKPPKKKKKGSGKEEGLMILVESTAEHLPWNHTFVLP